MKILHVLNTYFAIPYFLGDQLLFFHEKGYEEHIICSPSKEIDEYAKRKKFKYAEEHITRSISPLADLQSILKVCKYIKRNSISVIVGHTPKGALIAMTSGFIARAPKRIYFRHGLVYETSKGLKRFILKTVDRFCGLLATKIVCVSPSVMEVSLKDKLGPKSKHLILGNGTCNGVDTERFDKNNFNTESINQLKHKYQIQSNFVIGYVGRLVRDKGIIELVEAFIKFNQTFETSKLLLVGMFEDRDALPELTKSLIKTHPDIICTGYINNAEVDAHYALFDVFILPSYREGFPTVILEASSMELPVLTTNATGCVDAIIPNKTGLRIENNAESIFEALEKIHNDPQLAKNLGEFGRQHILENYKQEKVWEHIEELYTNV